jgi:hypothetical protein
LRRVVRTARLGVHGRRLLGRCSLLHVGILGHLLLGLQVASNLGLDVVVPVGRESLLTLLLRLLLNHVD